MSKIDQDVLVQNIRMQYAEKEYTDLDELKALDKRVKRPANVFGYLFGSAGAVIMGSGMSLVMTDIGEIIGMEHTMISGILVGLVGMLFVIINYPIYKKFLASRRGKYAEQIIQLSDSLQTETKL